MRRGGCLFMAWSCCFAFANRAIAAETDAGIRVGKNVLVSGPRATNFHYEVVAACDPGHAERLLVGSKINYDANRHARFPQSIAYLSIDGGLTWKIAVEPRDEKLT